MSQAEIEFGKLGFKRYEKNDIIVYYKPYDYEDVRVDDITFCKRTKKIIFYQGTEFGSDAYRTDYRILRAILAQCEELGWKV